MAPKARADAPMRVFPDSDDEDSMAFLDETWQEALQHKSPMEELVSSKSPKVQRRNSLVRAYCKRKRGSGKSRRPRPHKDEDCVKDVEDVEEVEDAEVGSKKRRKKPLAGTTKPSIRADAAMAAGAAESGAPASAALRGPLVTVPLELSATLRQNGGKMEVHAGRKTKSVIKPARNVGPKMIEENIEDELVELAEECVATLSSRGFKLCPTQATVPPYAHPFQGATANVSMSGTYSQRESTCRRVQALMLRQPSRHPLWAFPRDLPGCISKDLDYLILYCMAFNSAANPMCKEKSTEAKCLQCKRIRTGHVQRAQSASIVMTELASALVRQRSASVPPLPYAAHTFDPCDALTLDEIGRRVVVTSASLQCASMPCKMRSHSLMQEARRLARIELNQHLSATMRCDPDALGEICDSVLENRAAKHNAFWSSVALVCICNAHPATRMRMCLDALNLQYVQTLSIYACKEQTRRTNYANNMMKKINKKTNESDALKERLDSLQTKERQLSAKIREHRKHTNTVRVANDRTLEALLDQHVKVRNELFQVEHELTDALNGAESARVVRRKNGIDEEEDADELCNSRATLGSTPVEILQSWIKILNGHFIHVINAMSTVEDDAELSTITNVQIQLTRTEAQFEELQQTDAMRESHLMKRLWNMVRRVVGMMQHMVHTISLAPALKGQRWARVDETGNDPRVLLHAVDAPPTSLRPSSASAHRILWTRECMMMPEEASDKDRATTVGRLIEFATKRASLRERGNGAQGIRQCIPWRTEGHALTQQFTCVMPEGHAPTRSMLVFQTYTVDDARMHDLARRLVAEPTTHEPESSEDALRSTHAPTGCCAFPCLGLRLEWIAINLNQRRRATNLRLQFGATLRDRAVHAVPCEREHSVPTPIAAIGEFQAKAGDVIRDAKGTRHQSYAISYTVCASHATRVVDLVQHGNDDQAVCHGLAMLAVGMVHIGTLSQIGSMCTADDTISLLNNGQRIQQRADNSTMTNLTAFGLYAGGRSNLVRAMIGTPWEGCYPAWVDAGVTSLGVDARNYSDDRNPGAFYMSAETSKRYAKTFARKWLHPVSDEQCDQRPTPTRGVPLALVPGVHSALNAYDAALRVTHAKLRLPSHEQCEVMVFPVSPYAQQLGCIVPSPEWSADKLPAHVQQACDGRTINPDNTDPSLAVAHSSCVQPPMQLFPGDNLLENGLEEVGSFLAMASYLASVAMWCGRTQRRDASAEYCVSLLHQVIHRTLCSEHTQQQRSWQNFSHAALPAVSMSPTLTAQVGMRASVVLNAMYPEQHAVGERILHPAFERVVVPCLEGGRRPSAVDGAAASALQEWWSAFAAEERATCAWHQGVSELLVLMIQHDGRHALTSADCEQLREALHKAICASYWLYSRNGTMAIPASNPLHGVASTAQIQRHHVDGTFVVRHERSHSRGVEITASDGTRVRAACGGIVGLKFFQMQQLFTMLEARGSSAVPHFQLYRCGGQMLVRQSSDASDAPPSSGSARRESDKLKRFLCALFERDVESQGTIEERRNVCIRCERAWDRNLDTFLNIFSEIERPKPVAERMQGDALKPPLGAPSEELWTSTASYTNTLYDLAVALT